MFDTQDHGRNRVKSSPHSNSVPGSRRVQSNPRTAFLLLLLKSERAPGLSVLVRRVIVVAAASQHTQLTGEVRALLSVSKLLLESGWCKSATGIFDTACLPACLTDRLLGPFDSRSLGSGYPARKKPSVAHSLTRAPSI